MSYHIRVWLQLICVFQEKYLSAICEKVFQKFPDFVQRCKNEAFEALSDPVYSGKMKVQFRNKGSVTCSLWAVSFLLNISVFFFRFCRSCSNFICKGEIKCFFFLSQPRWELCFFLSKSDFFSGITEFALAISEIFILWELDEQQGSDVIYKAFFRWCQGSSMLVGFRALCTDISIQHFITATALNTHS